MVQHMHQMGSKSLFLNGSSNMSAHHHIPALPTVKQQGWECVKYAKLFYRRHVKQSQIDIVHCWTHKIHLQGQQTLCQHSGCSEDAHRRYYHFQLLYWNVRSLSKHLSNLKQASAGKGNTITVSPRHWHRLTQVAQLPGSKTWSQGICKKSSGTTIIHIGIVESNGAIYRFSLANHGWFAKFTKLPPSNFPTIR